MSAVGAIAAGRFTATAAQFVARLDRILAENPGLRWLILTEVQAGKFRRALKRWAKRNGFHRYHPLGPGANGCAVLVRDEPLEHGAWPLTDLRLHTKRKSPIHVVAVRTEGDGWTAVAHMPAHNGGLSSRPPFSWVTHVYEAAWNGLRRVRRRTMTGKIRIGGDTNVGLDRQQMRDRLGAAFPHLHWVWPDDKGRTIVGELTNHDDTARLGGSDEGFDHPVVLIDTAAVKR